MPLRHVDFREASPRALGILIPPGARTVVVVRPRHLDWDLLPVRWNNDPATCPAFCTFARDEAATIARGLAKFLQACDLGRTSPVQTLGKASACQVWVKTDSIHWLLCRRVPGRTYEPAIFPDLEQAQQAAMTVEKLVFPGPERVQDYYFNTQSFST